LERKEAARQKLWLALQFGGLFSSNDEECLDAPFALLLLHNFERRGIDNEAHAAWVQWDDWDGFSG
jgi:hypothetical protein